jgi:membrane protein implicated in regulation of membrane protease activity
MRRRRHVVAVDRTILTIVGLVLVLAGAVGIAIGSGLLRTLVPPDSALDMGGVTAALSASWWPVAAALTALLLVLLGLWWILAHQPGPRTKVLALSGSRTGDRLRIQPDAVAAAAQSVLEEDPHVRAASLGLRDEDHVLVVVGRVRVSPLANLDTVARRIDDALRDAGRVLGRELVGRVHLAVARRGKAERNVR